MPTEMTPTNEAGHGLPEEIIERLAAAKDKLPRGSDERKAVWQAIEYLRSSGTGALSRGVPEGPLSGKYGDVLRPFVVQMERELHANAGKGDRPGWLKMSPEVALLEIYYHLAKLQKAVKDDNGAGIQEYAADVANMSMMLLDICGGLGLIDDATTPAATASQPRALSLCEQLQQKCSQWGTYWRAPDAHGVILNQDQAMELLRDALGVEVEVSDWTPGAWSKLEAWLGTYADSIPNESYHELCDIQKLMNPKPQPAAADGGVRESAREILLEVLRNEDCLIDDGDIDPNGVVRVDITLDSIEAALTQQHTAAAEHWHDLYRKECRLRQDDAARYGQQIVDLEAALSSHRQAGDESLYALHSRFLSDTSGLPEEWQDWRNDFARDIRALVEKGAGS